MRRIILGLVIVIACKCVWAANGDMGVGTEPLTDGSPDYPYLIEDLHDFDVFAGNSSYWAAGVHTKLMTDIDLSGRIYMQAPIQTFSGNLDGQNHILFNLTVTGSRLCGLFGGVEGTSSNSAIVQNIILQKCTITSDAAYNGCLIGWARWHVIVQNCHIQQSRITSPYDLIGGLIGLAGSSNGGTPNIIVTMCSVTDTLVAGGNLVGGLIGAATAVNLQNCCVNCRVQGTSSIGGLVGGELNINTVTNCYSSGSVSGVDCIGGLIGFHTGSIENCYSTTAVSGTIGIGGLCGRSSSGSITGSYFQEDLGPDNTLGTPLTEAQMMMQANFADWDFVNDWLMLREGEDYPRLAWQEVFAGDLAGLYGVDMIDFAYLGRYWGFDDCGGTDDCGRADVDSSGDVSVGDLVIVANDWLKGSIN